MHMIILDFSFCLCYYKNNKYSIYAKKVEKVMFNEKMDSLYTKHTDTAFRLHLYEEARNIMEIEFGELPWQFHDKLMQYVEGMKELKDVRNDLIRYFKRPAKRKDKDGKDIMPLWDNSLLLYRKENLRTAILSIGIINMMYLDFNKVWSFNAETFCNVHKEIFKDIFPWGGSIRTVAYEKSIDFLENRKISFLEFDSIEPEIKKVMEELEDVSNIKNVDEAIRSVIRELNVGIDWEDMDNMVKATKIANVIGSLWMIHPFMEGNITADLYFAIKFSEYHGFPIDRKTLLSLHKKVNIKPALFFASLDKSDDYHDEKFFTSILQFAIMEGYNKGISSIPSTEERRNLKSLIEKAEEELGYNKNDEDAIAEEEDDEE